jgi:hypothetical protein
MAVKREAATLCADAILGQGVLTAFESQITGLVSKKAIDELTRNWDGKQCDEIAKIARALLGVRGYFTKVLQIIADWLLVKAEAGDMARFIARQLVTAVPVPWNVKLAAAARILQVTGICLCFANDRLMECRCLEDLVLCEGMAAINRLMTAAIHDWKEIPRRFPAPATTGLSS